MNKPYIYILDNDVDRNVIDVVQRKVQDLGMEKMISYKNQYHFIEVTDTNDIYICLERYHGCLRHDKNVVNNKRKYWNFSTYVKNCSNT